MFRPISVPACEVPGPPPTDAWFHSNDTHKVMHPDFNLGTTDVEEHLMPKHIRLMTCDVPLKSHT